MTYTSLLSKYKIIRDLSLIQLIVYFSSWFSNVAIYTLLVEFGSTELAISIVTAMHFLPGVIIAPFAGAIIDRMNIKTLMTILIITEFCMTLCFLFINDISQVWILMILIFIRMSAASMFFTTQMTLFGGLLKGKVLQKTNEIHSIIWSLSYASGMAISGVAVHHLGVKTAFIIDASLFCIAFFFFLRLDLSLKQKKIKEGIFKLIKDGFLYIKSNKIIIYLIVLHSSVGLTTFDTLITLLAKNDYKYVISVPLSIGISNAIRAMALMIGPFFISKYVHKNNLQYLFLIQGFTILFWAMVQSNFYLSLVALFFVGFSTTILWSFTYALLQENCNEKYLGRVISYNEMIFMLSSVGTTLFIGLMASLTTLGIITIILGIGFILFAIYYKIIIKYIN